MQEINDRHFRILKVVWGVFQMVQKWMIGVVIRRLLDASFPTEVQETFTQETKALLDFVFLFDLSFYWVVGLSISASAVQGIISSYVMSWAAAKSTNTGRKLRSDILARAVDSSGGSGSSDISHTANELIVKLGIIESFQAHDEHWIVKCETVVASSLVFSTLFAWYAGLVAIAMFATTMFVVHVIEKMRHKNVVSIEKNSVFVNARLLDIIKNGVKIKIMNQLASERVALRELEETSDDPRESDAQFKFYSQFVKAFLFGVIPTAMAIVAFNVISSSDPALAMDIGSAVLVSILLLEEAHKAFVQLAFVLDNQVRAADAQNTIDRFLGKKDSLGDKEATASPTTSSSDGETNTSNSRRDLDATTDAEKCDVVSAEVWTRTTRNDGNQLSLNGVVPRYLDRDHPVLKNYTQCFERGQIHALVGESGTGKSTVLKVIADLIRPESGSIEHWNDTKIAYVSQDQKLFARSIRENVTYGAKQEVADDDVWSALNVANIDHWVASLPAGLDEVLVGGEEVVSGGQLQRLNLAHLFCTCQDADLVILDEVLSALDETSRGLLMDRLQAFLKGKTGIIITHHSELLRICAMVHEMPLPKLFARGSARRRRSSLMASARSQSSSSFRRSSLRDSLSESIRESIVGDRAIPASVLNKLEEELNEVDLQLTHCQQQRIL